MDSLPAPFSATFLDDLPYEPAVFPFDRLEALDPERSRVACRMPTDVPLPLTDQQRVHDTKHPRHLSGGLLVHSTGMLGFVHAYYALGLRHAEGWIGYGTHIHSASFRKLVPPGSPIFADCVATKVRRGKSRCVVRYEFEYRHEGDVCYRGDQSAMWTLVAD